MNDLANLRNHSVTVGSTFEKSNSAWPLRNRYKNQHNLTKSRNNSLSRFSNTLAALQEAGLMEVTLESAKLIWENKQLQKAIDELQDETLQRSKALQVNLQKQIKL